MMSALSLLELLTLEQQQQKKDVKNPYFSRFSWLTVVLFASVTQMSLDAHLYCNCECVHNNYF